MLIYVPLVCIAVAFVMYRYFTRTFNYWQQKKVVGPEPVPLFGNVSDLVFQRKFIGTALKDIYNQFPDEKIVGFYRMTRPCLLVRDANLIKHVMIKDFDVFADRGVELSKEGLGANLFTADVDSWRILRTRFSPIFTSGKLKNMLHLISERSDKFIQDFEEISTKQPEQEVQSITRMYTMSSIAACAFGLDIDFNDGNMKVLNKLDKLILEVHFVVEFILMYPSLLKFFNNIIFPSEVTNFFYDLVKTVFAQRNHKPSARKDFMDLILELKQQKVIHGHKNVDESEKSVELTDGMIAAQAFVFYVAGYETSSTTLGFLLYELTKNHNIQDKLIAEIDKLMESCAGEDITYDLLMDMPYMSKVFDETLRKYPIADPLMRCAQADYKIPGTDVTIEKGQMIFVSVAGLHYDEKYFPNPEVFDPERFSADNSRDRHSCVYLPFGTGPRNCIGMRFAKVQSRMFLVKLLSRFRVESSANTPHVMKSNPKRALLGPKHAIKLNIVPRIK